MQQQLFTIKKYGVGEFTYHSLLVDMIVGQLATFVLQNMGIVISLSQPI
jgi:hypothetical protein